MKSTIDSEVRVSKSCSIEGKRFYDRTPTFLSSYCSSSSNNSIQNDICTRQDAAFAAFDLKVSHSTRIYKLFSYESIHQGKRHFIAADLDEFLSEYYQIPISNRHCYEIIRETFPCRLYFDLEFSKVANPALDGDDLTKKWINLVLWKINEFYNLALSWEHVMVLDSSTEVKYSKHVNLLLRQTQNSSTLHASDEYLFSNNIAVGVFVQDILLSITRELTDFELENNNPSIIIIPIANKRHTPLQEYLDFWVLQENDHDINSRKRVLFIDTGVYSRNRAFRLCGSCKFGKTKVFGLTAKDAKQYRNVTIASCGGSVQACRQQLLLDSFVVPHDLLVPTQNATVVAEDQLEEGMNSIVEYAAFDAFLPFFNSRKYHILPRTKSIVTNTEHRHLISFFNPTYSASHTSSLSSAKWCDGIITQSHESRQNSWFTHLDLFIIEAYCSRGSPTPNGYIRSWCLYQTPTPKHGFVRFKQRYQISGNRFCEHVNRSHKSNGIFIDVDLMAQEVKQGCWDHECRQFAFVVRSLPHGLLPSPVEIEAMVEQYKTTHQKAAEKE